jgi:hypothetical protein
VVFTVGPSGVEIREDVQVSRSSGRTPVTDDELDERILQDLRSGGPARSKTALQKRVAGEAARVRGRIDALSQTAGPITVANDGSLQLASDASELTSETT